MFYTFRMSSTRSDPDTAAGASSAPRRYVSPLRSKRAEETRATLVRAATELFTTNGWTNTGMRDIAREAGVAVETLYKHYSSKRKLLDAVVDQAAAGDSDPIAVATRPEFLAMGEGRRADRVAAAASIVAAIHDRTGRFAKLIREAATTDPEIADVLRETRERQRTDVATGMELILGRPPTDDERDGTWAILSPEVYLLLIEESGWSLPEYEHWMATTLARLLART
jgi:AcrR family transcriptional regulator